MMLNRNTTFTKEDLDNNPPCAEHLTNKNSLEVAMLEEWEAYERTLEEALNFIKKNTNQMRNMIKNGTTWEKLAEHGQNVVEEFETYVSEIEEMF